MVEKLFSKIYSKLQYEYQRYQESLYVSSLNCIASCTSIKYPCIIKNPDCIDIGKNFYFGPNSRLEAINEFSNSGQKFNPIIKIGDNVSIQGNCHIGAINKIIIGNGVLMGNGVFITDHSHGNSSLSEISIIPTDRKLYSKGPVEIGDNVWLCERTTILPNVNIGDGSIIAAGAVVTTDIPPNCVAGGGACKSN